MCRFERHEKAAPRGAASAVAVVGLRSAHLGANQPGRVPQVAQSGDGGGGPCGFAERAADEINGLRKRKRDGFEGVNCSIQKLSVGSVEGCGFRARRYCLTHGGLIPLGFAV